ncbi:MAG: hypothetical protein DMF58_20960 [Acidobacteria bacterium]|nr:MAG: hypothetical protein DMF58_20960 [Acidobacteriota bacterium]
MLLSAARGISIRGLENSMANQDKKATGQHHSKAKGAAIGAVVGKLVGGGKKSAAAGAVIGAEKQHRKNKEGR